MTCQNYDIYCEQAIQNGTNMFWLLCDSKLYTEFKVNMQIWKYMYLFLHWPLQYYFANGKNVILSLFFSWRGDEISFISKWCGICEPQLALKKYYIQYNLQLISQLSCNKSRFLCSPNTACTSHSNTNGRYKMPMSKQKQSFKYRYNIKYLSMRMKISDQILNTQRFNTKLSPKERPLFQCNRISLTRERLQYYFCSEIPLEMNSTSHGSLFVYSFALNLNFSHYP